ncbi:hypothetical protein BJ170DRAFT_601639 [Xylariales sp. AK1849]|nr:hypothetical protein BJ170DRAFT_601639 [Xylariales sp. AK1849]
MSIIALPESDVRQLGSPLVISTPISLVKELLDNAIDAKATTVEVLISPNTIDKIEVRDNGIGIHPNDYDSLGRRGHTSKLKTFEELRTLAGTTLGFRGEALASANAMAQVTITTKTSSDPVAAVLQIIPKTGGVLKHKVGSAPVGTTVSITGLYSELRVREQIIVKEVPKTLDKIKELLRSYAMARPQLKLALKVLKTPKLNWTYPPTRDADIKEAVRHLFGTEVVAQCLVKTGSFGRSTGEDTLVEAHDGHPEASFVFEALMIRPKASFTRLPKLRYFSVDHRPIAGSKGTIKKLMSVYLKYLGNAPESGSLTKPLGDAFIRININCPRGSYDVNIEPSKDNVLFQDEQSVIDYFEEFCQDVYGPLKVADMKTSSQAKGGENSPSAPDEEYPFIDYPPRTRTHNTESDISREDAGLGDTTAVPILGGEVVAMELPQSDRICDHELSKDTSRLPRTRSFQRSQSPPAPSTGATINTKVFQRDPDYTPIQACGDEKADRGPLGMSSLRTDMSTDFSERTDGYTRAKKRARTTQHITPSEDTVRGMEYPAGQDSNPWSIARLTAHHEQTDSPTVTGALLVSQDMNFSQVFTPDPDVLRHRGAPPRDLDVPPSLRHPYIRGDENSVPHASNRSPVSSPMRAYPRQSNVSQRRRVQPPWTPPSSIQKAQEQWKNENSSSRKLSPAGFRQTTLSFDRFQHPREPRHSQGNGDKLHSHPQARNAERGPIAPVHPQNILFTATQNFGETHASLSEQEDGSSVPLTQRSPTARKRATQRDKPFASLCSANVRTDHSCAEDKEPIPTLLPSGDPRAYLLRRQKSVAAAESTSNPKKLRRMKSNLLPMENIPIDGQIHGLILPAHVNMQYLSESVAFIERYDKYVIEGDVTEALDIDLSESRIIEERLDMLLSNWSEKLTGETVEVESNLSALLKGKGVEVQL